MPKKNSVRTFGGWMLAEVLCCVIIVSTIAICVTESTNLAIRVAKWIQNRRTHSIDYGSLVNEISSMEKPFEVRRGTWQANIENFKERAGMKFADVSIATEISGKEKVFQWKSWEITGRHK
jgi:hypothetical protein